VFEFCFIIFFFLAEYVNYSTTISANCNKEENCICEFDKDDKTSLKITINTPHACPTESTQLHWSTVQIILLIFFLSLGLIFVVGLPIMFCVYLKYTKSKEDYSGRRVQLIEK
jgi:hypothetical protein